MSFYPEALETIQWAREATPGLDLPATSKVALEKFDLIPDSENARPKLLRGVMVDNRGNETVVRRGATWKAEFPLNFEQMQNWCSGLVKAAVVGVGTAPTVWTFARALATIPVLDTFTFERRDTEGASPVDHAIHYGMMQKMTLSFNVNELVMAVVEGFSRRIQTGETMTAALTMPSVELIPTTAIKVYINDTWAGLGSPTQVTNQVMSGEFVWKSGAMPWQTTDGRADQDLTTHVVNADEVGLECTLTMLMGAQYATERAAAEANTLRAVRIEMNGTAGRQIQIDFLARYDVPELFELGELNGQKIVPMKLVSAHDGTNLMQIKVSNLITTLI